MKFPGENHPTEASKAYNRGLRRAVYRLLTLLALLFGIGIYLMALRAGHLSTELGRAAYNAALWHVSIMVVVVFIAIWLILFSPLARNMKNDAMPRWGRKPKKKSRRQAQPGESQLSPSFNMPTDD